VHRLSRKLPLSVDKSQYKAGIKVVPRKESLSSLKNFRNERLFSVRGECVFLGGIVFLLAGAFFGYGAKWILLRFGRNESKSAEILFILKTIGFIFAIVGSLMIFSGEFPEKLEFIRIL